MLAVELAAMAPLGGADWPPGFLDWDREHLCVGSGTSGLWSGVGSSWGHLSAVLYSPIPSLHPPRALPGWIIPAKLKVSCNDTGQRRPLWLCLPNSEHQVHTDASQKATCSHVKNVCLQISGSLLPRCCGALAIWGLGAKEGRVRSGQVLPRAPYLQQVEEEGMSLLGWGEREAARLRTHLACEGAEFKNNVRQQVWDVTEPPWG